MRLRITADSFFYRKTLEIPEVPVDKMALIFVWMTSSSEIPSKFAKFDFVNISISLLS